MYEIIKRKSVIVSFIGAVCMALPVFFLYNTVAAGIFCTAGLIILFCGGRIARNASDAVINAVLIWLSHSIRLSQFFGTQFLLTLVIALLFIPFTAIMAVSLWAERILIRKKMTYLSVAVMPAVYMAVDFLLSAVGLGFVSNMMGYAMCLPVVSSNLSLFGEYFLTFVLMLVFTCISYIFTVSGKKPKVIFGAAAFALVIAILIIGAVVNSRYSDEPDYSVKVALATSNDMNFYVSLDGYYIYAEQIDMFHNALKTAADGGADLLVLNEEYFMWLPEGVETNLESVAEIIRQYGIPVIAGVEIANFDGISVNQLLYFDGDGNILYTYIKNNLVPLVETGLYEDGPEKPAALNVNLGGHDINLTYIICSDINDADYVRKIPRDTEMLVVPSWDWDKENAEQLRTVCNSAGLGVTLVKHSHSGFSTVNTPTGECTEFIDFRDRYEQVEIVDVPIWEK